MIELINWEDCFVKNDFYYKYLNLIEENKNTIKSIETQTHHIIPRCFFKYKNIKVDNSSENLVHLSFSNHLLAHYYLSQCTTGKFKYAMQSALRYLTKGFDYNDIVTVIPKWEDIYIEYNKAISEKQKGHEVSKVAREKISKAHKGKPAHNKGKPMPLEQRLHLSEVKKGKKHKPHSEETKRKISEANKNKIVSKETREKISLHNLGKHLSKEAREKISEQTSNKRWYTNGVDSIYIDKDLTPPTGYTPGRTYTRKVMTKEEHLIRSIKAKEREKRKKEMRIKHTESK